MVAKPLTHIDPRVATLVFIAIIVCVAMFILPAIPQDPNYHLFIDTRSWLGIPNFANVLTNLPFAVIGVFGLYSLSRHRLSAVIPGLHWAYFAFFIGIILTGVGSGYYHWNPNNATLVWDRLPMALAFMPFFAIIFAENVSVIFARRFLIPMMVLGAFSVAYWYYTESQGRGDLRLYALVQFLPLLLIPLVLLMFKSRFDGNRFIWFVILSYLFAKIFEALDEPMYNLGFLVSGHSIKHLTAALGTYLFLLALKRRKPVEVETR